MLAIILKILSILGIILLILLCIFLLLLFLVLFFPVSYKLYGCKNGEDINIRVKVKWLFGLLRLTYLYPQPGKLKIKLMFFTLFDGTDKTDNKKKTEVLTETNQTVNETVCDKKACSSEKSIVTEASEDIGTVKESILSETFLTEEDSNAKGSIKNRILEKYEKIKYTIQKIYAKIKYIWENIRFYKELLLSEDTKALISHILRRVGNILKKLKPRKLKAELLFGTGEPDTTGYLLGVYGILSTHIKKPSYVNLTPDFEQAVLEGNVEAVGNIQIVTILVNGIKLLMDKRLHILISKIKKHSAASKLQKQ